MVGWSSIGAFSLPFSFCFCCPSGEATSGGKLKSENIRGQEGLSAKLAALKDVCKIKQVIHRHEISPYIYIYMSLH